ncbi:hypothetical protein O0L34_g14094 [Tuta absoluta]|nr:hypothetical protein O0L34_g14094 [Tuta absoluta]
MTRRVLYVSLVCLLYLNEITCKSKIRRFPPKFMFGASTAAYQIEGGWNEGGKSESIWDVATHLHPELIKDGSNGDVAADSYHQYKRDVELMKDLGLHFYRFSISWSRILPTGYSNNINQAGVDYYNNLIDEMLQNNIKPFVTMYHWDLPAELQKLGGWTNPHVADWFADYAKVLYDKFGSKVDYWITINEPKQICYEGYGADKKAPFLNATGIADYYCAKNVLLAHAKAYRIYDEKYRKTFNGSVGISVSCTWFQPASDSQDDHQAAQDARMFDWGIYTHPIFSTPGDWPVEVKRNVAHKSAEQGFSRSRLPKLTATEVTLIKGSSDFFGMNTYTTKLAYRDPSLDGMYPVPSYMDDMSAVLVKDHTWTQAQSTWLQDVPWGFHKLLKEVKKLYGNPVVYVTENGWSTAGGLLDDDRITYLRHYLNAMLNAIDEGCKVRAYSAWSLMDNFEWRNGYTEKFGLYEVDFSSPERTRTPRKSSYVYKQIIQSMKLDPDFEPHYLVQTQERKQQEKDANDVF